jgi:hypothetical protein
MYAKMDIKINRRLRNKKNRFRNVIFYPFQYRNNTEICGRIKHCQIKMKMYVK